MPSEIVQNETRLPPEWLNNEYLTKALREGLQEPVLSITTFHIKPAVAAGENFFSVLFRVRLQIVRRPRMQTERLSIICKTLPSGEGKSAVIEGRLFENEAFTLSVTMPAINRILNEIEPDEQPLCADLIYFSTEPEQIIILQDLKELGFSNIDRKCGLDLETSKFVLRKLARLHAASLHLLRTHPEKVRRVNEGLIRNRDKFVEDCLAQLISEVSQWNEFSPEYVDKLRDLQSGVFDMKLREAYAQRSGSLQVLHHGDCWGNNVMFSKNDAGMISGLRFIDFPKSRLNSAAIDLNYFLFTSAHRDIRVTKLDEMLRCYYEKFMDTTARLDLDLRDSFTFDDLKREFRSTGFVGFAAAIIVYPLIIQDNEFSLDVLVKKEESKKLNVFKSYDFRDSLNRVFPYFVDSGVV